MPMWGEAMCGLCIWVTLNPLPKSFNVPKDNDLHKEEEEAGLGFS
jgi:hypothetical protein